MKKLLRLLDDNILSFAAGFLLVFIPLYPKIPLFDLLPGYIVRARLEDFAVLGCVLMWLIYLFRGKIKLKDNPLFKPILIYTLIAILSMLSAAFLTKTVPLEKIHLQKMIIHFVRRLEYFSLFFIFFSAVKSPQYYRKYLLLIIFTTIGVSLYGFGQKYLYWPAFSTMNREFAKGWMLYLTKHARVISTFGGHYDLAAWIMMILVLLWSVFFAIKSWFWKLIIFIVLSGAFWTLILTASRTSFIAYIVGVSFLFFFYAFRKGLAWSFIRWTAVVLLSLTVMLSFGDLSERFTKLLRIDQRVAGIKSLLLSPIGKPPQDKALFLSNDQALSEITSSSDQPPTRMRPSDVFEDIPLLVRSTESGTLSAVARTYSQTAFRYDLSTAIRLDALWPMAINGFKKNPLLGSGYSTLNKLQPTQWTEAESTDNDYLRALGETGFLGFAAFFGMLLYICYYIWRNLNVINDPLLFATAVGLIGLVIGLCVNAMYIDVFESSKVAFTFWAMTGITLGSLKPLILNRKGKIVKPVIPGLKNNIDIIKNRLWIFVKSDKAKVFLILSIALILRLYKIDRPLADWHSWRQADTSAVTRNFIRHGINMLYPSFDDLSNIASGKDNPKGLRFVEFPLYNVAAVITDKIFIGRNVEFSGRLTSVFVSLIAMLFLFGIVKKYLSGKIALWSIFFFAVLPYNIYYNRVILPEPFFVFTTLGMIYFMDKFSDFASRKLLNPPISKNKLLTGASLYMFGLFIASLIFSSAAVLVKPYAVFLFIPVSYIWFKYFHISPKSIFFLLFYWLIVLTPFILWRNWMNNFPEGIPANMWLLNGDGIRFKGAFFYWLFADRLSRLILGYFGVSLLIAGILYKKKGEGMLFDWWGIAMLFYLSVFATGNVRHDYYQIILVPIVCVFLAKGICFYSELFPKFRGKIFSWTVVVIIILFMEMFGWYHIRDFYNINHPEIVEAGSELDRITSPASLVIAPYNGDTAFLYQTGRAGWPVLQDNIDRMIGKGAHYFVSVNFDSATKELVQEALNTDPLKKRFKILKLTDKYVIIQLVSDKNLPK
ncbi:hypothetical protein A2Y99_02330 [Candidatus Gottesmanbacteria bacterium RBG_13_37_7]|uniref:O-antigen ligase-related domain-containing protein n=1 Tax=Candidatus Gottesmanbacteria bacterium RBG_13_37_7 TaxID=1798369 RepID=A0A1F5YIJ2_9BACT|nr:MAG: hypothetical protein A2Y99_02330 [Candidatus Gottesmanbacteria bacterium RBG_13_37_7]